ncbi:MAG TPA: ATP/GTP-binding protein [Coriobacteriia bacterium]|nr:ATP/GTP-binding protein [Coriobacteriia bacterium]
MQSVKIVVTGPFNAGKTTFIKSVSEITVLSTEREVSDATPGAGGETTVAMDFGRITISDDIVLYLFGTPGQERFSFMWETLSEGMLGFVLLVDATDESSMDDAAGIVSFFRAMSSVPFVIAANRAESQNGELGSLHERLGLDSPVEVLAVDARDRESVKNVLIALLRRILETME